MGEGAVATSEVLNDTATGGGLTAADLRSGSVGSAEIATGGVRSADVQDERPMAAGSRAPTSPKTRSVAVNFSSGCWTPRPHVERVHGHQRGAGQGAYGGLPCSANGEEVTGGGYVISNNGVNVPSVVVQRSYAVASTLAGTRRRDVWDADVGVDGGRELHPVAPRAIPLRSSAI